MSGPLNRNPSSLDSQAFAVVLSTMFICALAWIIAPVIGEPAVADAVIAAAASQLKCASL